MDVLPPLQIDDEETGENELVNVVENPLASLALVDGFNGDPFLNVDFCSFKLQSLLGRSIIWIDLFLLFFLA